MLFRSDFRAKPENYENFKEYFIGNNVFGIATDNPKAFANSEVNYVKKKDKEYFATDVKTYYKEWETEASRTITARYDFTLKPFKDITGGKVLAGLDKLSYVLNGNDILTSAFLNTDYLITMFSNGANDFDGIDLNALLGAEIGRASGRERVYVLV